MKSIFAFFLIMAAAPFAFADMHGAWVIMGPKIFEPMKGTKVTAGYVTWRNLMDKPITVQVLAADGFKAVEMHQTTHEGDKMKMQKIDKLTIPAKGSVELKPGGYHLMLFEPAKSVKVGTKVLVHLLIDGKHAEMEFPVVKRPAGAMKHQMDHMKGHGDKKATPHHTM